jgi:hypothetical protein
MRIPIAFFAVLLVFANLGFAYACFNLSGSTTAPSIIQGDMTAGFTVNGSITICPGTYNFTGVSALTVTGQNVTINCMSGSLVGDNTSGTSGIFSNQYNTTIKNCNIFYFAKGIYFSSATNGTITNSSATSAPTGIGIYLETSSGNTINSSTGTSSIGTGINMYSSSYNALINSTGISDSNKGIDLYQGSSYNNIINSTGTSNSDMGIYLSTNSNLNNITGSNGNSTTGDGIQIYSSANNTLTNSNGSSDSSFAIHINSGANNTILGCIGAANSGQGITLESSSYDQVTNSNGTSNSNDGIHLYNSVYETIFGSRGSSNSFIGIHLNAGSGGNTFIGSTGISDSFNGIELNYVSNNSFTESVGHSNTGNGIYLDFSDGNSFTGSNGTCDSGDGFYISSSSNNNFTGSTGSSGGSVGFAIFTNSNNNTFSNGRIEGNDSIFGALEFYISCVNNTVANSTINGKTGVAAVTMYSNCIGNALVNDTLLNASILLYIDSYSGGNIFCWDNFTDATMYADDTDGGNYYNSSLCDGEGNIWTNVMSGEARIFGTASSTGFPTLFVGNKTYNDSVSLGKVSGVADYAPLTANIVIALPTYINISVSHPGGSILQNDTFNVTVNVSCAGPDCGLINVSVGMQSVYVLQGGDSECTDYIKPILESGGYSVTCGVQKASYDGSVDLSSYSAVMVLDGTSYSSPMPGAGQTSIENYVASGGGLIIFEWSAYEHYPFIIADRVNGFETGMVYSKIGSHQITDGLPDSWSAPACGRSTLSPHSGTTAILHDDTDGGAMLVVLDNGSGKVAQFGMSPGYNDYDCWNSSSSWDTNMTALLKNAVGWVANGNGLIPVPMDSGSPFFSKGSDPRQITLGDGESQSVVFWLNATGEPGSYGLLADAVLLSNDSVADTSAPWLVDIRTLPPPPAPTEGTTHPVQRESLTISESFNCSSGELTVSVEHSGSGVPDKPVRLMPVFGSGYQEEQTDSSGVAVFNVSSDGSYQLNSPGTSEYLSLTTDQFELDLCPAQTTEAVNQTLPGCADDSACGQDQRCVKGDCVAIECSCGQIANHACSQYACCSDSQCGADRVCQGHACVTVMQNQTQLNNTPSQNNTHQNQSDTSQNVTPPTGPTLQNASAAIARAVAAINSASDSGKDVTGAQAKLSDAKAALASGNYALATQLAVQARDLAANAAAPQKPSGLNATVQPQLINQLSRYIWLVCIAVIAVYLVARRKKK